MALDFLPPVEVCCFSIDLKLGSILIAICSWFFCGAGYLGRLDTKCLDVIKSRMSGVVNLIQWVTDIAFVLGIVHGCAGLLLLIGILMEVPVLVAIFVWAAFILAAFLFIMRVFMLIILFVNMSGCQAVSFIYSFFNFLTPILCFYFTIVVNSFEEEMA